MFSKTLSKLLVVFLLMAQPYFFLLDSNIPKVQGSTTKLSLITPYYGSKNIVSYFDHNYPMYGENSTFVRYDGEKWEGNVSIGTCASSINCYDNHRGLDIDINYEEVLASADGTVLRAEWDSDYCHNGTGCGFGLVVEIRHIVNSNVYKTIYAHLTTVAVEVGEDINKGKIIGTSGSTGASTGPHLHFEVLVCINTICKDPADFRPIDPFGWQPTESAPILKDPWAFAQNPNGADSWCMWEDGEFVNKCNPKRTSSPILKPAYGMEFIVEDNTSGFSKGFNGQGNSICDGIDPICREWWETQWLDGITQKHTFRTIGNGLAGDWTTVDNWAKWKPQNLVPGDYEVFVYIPSYLGSDNDTFTWQANFIILDSKGEWNRKIVDEYIGIGQNYNPRNKWLSLGIHSLDSTYSAVYLFDSGENAPAYDHCPDGYYTNEKNWCRVVADDVKFVQVKYYSFLPNLKTAPTSTLTPTLIPTSTPTSPPPTNPEYNICEPNETVLQWGTTPSNGCVLNSRSYYLYPVNGLSTDADVFRYGYYLSSPSEVTVTFYLRNVPANCSYKFEVYNASKNYIGTSVTQNDGTPFFSVNPTNVGKYNYYYIRVYSEYGFSSIDKYYFEINYINTKPPDF